MLDTIILIRNIFYKCFLIGVLYILLVYLIYVFNPRWALSMVETYYRIPAKDFTLLFAITIASMKVILTFFMLIPALALHWTSWVLKKQKK